MSPLSRTPRLLAAPLLTAACLVLAVPGCGSDPTPDENSAAVDSSDTKPVIAKPSGTPPARLTTETVIPGTGAVAKAGSTVLVDYVGASWSTGKEFDASWGREPFGLTIGSGQVIKGWDQGLEGMKVGERRRLTIPPDLGYGSTGQGDIAPDETLIFVVDLRYAGTKPSVDVSGAAGATKLVTEDLTPGTGKVAAEGSQVSVHYVGATTDGKEFDESFSTGRPIAVTLGAGQVIEGWDKGLLGMKEGGRRRIVIPPALGYGAAGNGPIPPDSVLVFVVDLVKVS